MTLLVILVLAFVAVFAWQFTASRNALAVTRVESHRSAEDAARIVQNAFTGARNALWTGASGPGAINMRRRGKGGGIVLSVDIEPLPSGGSATNMWASSYNEYLVVLANFAGSVNSRKKAIAQLLHA
jgi:hypothetical protein